MGRSPGEVPKLYEVNIRAPQAGTVIFQDLAKVKTVVTRCASVEKGGPRFKGSKVNQGKAGKAHAHHVTTVFFCKILENYGKGLHCKVITDADFGHAQ